MRIEESLGAGFVRLRVAEAERRQAKHDIRCVEDAAVELLRNARDAGAKRIFVALSKDRDVRTLTVADDGCGIPPHLHERVFDARVTSKLDTMCMDRWGVHGRGMALYSIRENALEAAIVASDTDMGTIMRVSFDTSRINERADQSTWPVVMQDHGKQTVRGPRNVIRTCVEFALETKGQCRVYVGSPSEMIATMRTRAHMVREAPTTYVEMPAYALNARELVELCRTFGIVMSERTAHRIVRGDIRPLRNAASEVLGSPNLGAPVGTPAHLDRTRRLVLTEDDKDAFATACARAFEEIAARYYVTLYDRPTIKVTDGKVFVTLPYMDDD